MRLPYIQVTVDVIELAAPDLAIELKRREADIGWGLVKMFVRALARCPDHIPPSKAPPVTGPNAAKLIAHSAGYTGDPDGFVDACCHCTPPLLERTQDGIRFRGLDRYDAAWENSITRAQGRSARAKHAAEVRWGINQASSEHDAQAGPSINRASLEHSKTDAQAMLQNALDVDRDLNRDLDQKDVVDVLSISEEAALAFAEGRGPPVPLPPVPEDRFSSGPAFFAWVQHQRHDAGFAAEKPPNPRKLSAWFSEFCGELQGDVMRAEETLHRWAKDDWWREKNLPFQGFMSQWRKYVPQRRAS